MPRWVHLLVVLFLGLHLALSIRGCLHDDDRHAWRMFSGTVQYRVTYRVVDADGRSHAYTPGPELWGRGRAYLRSDRWHRGFHGLGATRSHIRGYLAALRARSPDVSVVADLKYRRGGAVDWQYETIEAP